MEQFTQIWNQYRRGFDYLSADGLFERAEQCHRMVGADQWRGLRCGEERPAQLNILLPS
jgi:hypothetical protein